MRRALVHALCLLLAIGIAPRSRAQTQPRSGEHISVTVVEVPVNVYDRDGNPLRGLTAADFEITDDGKKRDITHFEQVDLVQAGAGNIAPPAAARRNFMLLFDLANSQPGTIRRAREAALEFVEKQLTPADVVAVATYSLTEGFMLLMNFTSDRESLVAAVSTVGDPGSFRNADPILITTKAEGMAEMGAAEGGEAGAKRAARDAQAAEVLAEPGGAVSVSDEVMRGRIAQQIRAFAEVARILDAVSGRKQIILLSEGFEGRLVRGRDAFGGTGVAEQSDASKVIHGQGYMIDNDARFGNTASATTVSNMGELFKRSDVVLHAIDIKGLRVAGDTYSGNKRTSLEGLYVLTEPTGGEVFKNRNELAGNFRALLRQQEVVYILAFEVAGGATPGKFHNLKVKVKAPGARTSYRPGYYESGGRAAMSAMEATLTAGEILLNDVALDGVKTNVVATPFPVAGRNPQVPVVVEVDGASLVSDPQVKEVQGEIFVYAFDRQNKVVDFLYQKLNIDLTKVADILQKSGVKYYGTLSLPPGDYAIKTLVRLRDARLDGFRRVDVTVPDFSQPTVLAPVAIEQPGGWVMVRGGAKISYPYPFAVAAESFVPGGMWQLSPAGSQRFALFMYHVDPKELALGATLKMPNGATRPADVAIVGMTAPDAQERSQLVLELKGEGLAAGRYALDLSVKPKSGGWAKAFTIPVSVQ